MAIVRQLLVLVGVCLFIVSEVNTLLDEQKDNTCNPDDIAKLKDKGFFKKTSDVATAVRRFMKFARSTDRSGKCTDEFHHLINKERCGDKDYGQGKNTTSRQSIELLGKWTKSPVKYYVYNSPRQYAGNDYLSQSRLMALTGLALDVWACHANINFQAASSLNDADFVMTFGGASHYATDWNSKRVTTCPDNRAFGSPGAVLAHCYFPTGSQMNGNCHYDDGETWSSQTPQGTNYFYVATHEVGHGIGIGHITRDGTANIMYPYAPAYKPEHTFNLGSLDIWAAQTIYGARQCYNKKWLTLKPPGYKRSMPDGDYEQKLDEERRQLSCGDADDSCAKIGKSECGNKEFKERCKETCNLCRGKRAAEDVCSLQKPEEVFDFDDGFTYFIANGKLYRRSDRTQMYDQNFGEDVDTLWPQLSAFKGNNNISAIIFVKSASKLIFFTGNKALVLHNMTGSIIRKPPQVTTHEMKGNDYPVNPTAAFVKLTQRGTGIIQLVKDKKTFGFNINTMNLTGEVALLQDLFEFFGVQNRLPTVIDGAYHIFDADFEGDVQDSLFFFTGSSYYVAYPHPSTGKYIIPMGYPAPFMTDYLGCKNPE